MTALLSTPFIPVSRFMHSHRAAQGVIYADQIKNSGVDIKVNMTLDLYDPDFNKYDSLYVYHGNDWSGHLNLFGGLKDFPYVDNFVNFSKFRGPVFSLVDEFPDYRGLLEHKIQLAAGKGKDINPLWNEVDWDNVEDMMKRSVLVKIPGGKTDQLVVGDSHAPTMYRPGWTIVSIPFKTLHGALKIGLKNLVETHYGSSMPAAVEFYFGNIDVRHHLLRQESPSEATAELATEYVKQADEVAAAIGPGARVRIYELLPIESEDRTIPKTGWYEGAPFHGSRINRDYVRLHFRDACEELCKKFNRVELVRWTDHLLNEKGELSFDMMERPKSVHLSRAAYPWWQGWEWSGLKQPPKLASFFL